MTLAEQSARRIEALAEDPTFGSRREDLARLGQALRTPTEETEWSGVSLFSAFPADSTVSVHSSARMERLLGVLAGVTVFLPVAWTWWSLREASEAYERAIAANQVQGKSFLQLWTTGFDGGLSPMHQLAPMALVSLLLIAACICLIVGHRVATHRAARRERMATIEAEAELASALTWAQQALIRRDVEDPAQVASLVRSSLTQLTAAHEATRETAERLREAAAQASAVWRSATEASASTIVEATQRSEESLRQAGDTANEQLAALLENAVRTSAHTQQQTDAAVSCAADTMRGSAARLSEALGGFAAAQAALDGSSTRLADAVSGLAAGGRSAVDRFSADLAALASHMKGMLGAVQGIQLELGSTGAATRSQVSELSRAREATQFAALELQAVSDSLRRLTAGSVR